MFDNWKTSDSPVLTLLPTKCDRRKRKAVTNRFCNGLTNLFRVSLRIVEIWARKVMYVCVYRKRMLNHTCGEIAEMTFAKGNFAKGGIVRKGKVIGGAAMSP